MPDDIAPQRIIPSPDPSVLTTEQLRHELTNLRDLLETRLYAMDKAQVLLNENVTRFPTEVDKQVGHLRELHGEKFGSIDKQFDERDVRSKAAEIAAQVAVSAALQAQKEAAAAQNDSNAVAVKKSEDAVTKQIDGILALLASNTRAIDEKIGSISGRLDRGEGSTTGRADQHTERRLDVGSLIGIISAALLFLSVMAGITGFTLKH